MNREQTKGILAAVQAVYPAFLNGRDPQVTVDVWQTIFEAEPFALVKAATMAFFSTDTKGFAPSPGQIKAQISMLQQRDEMTETQAWALVNKALHNGLYGYRAQYEKLPKLIQQCVGAPEMLREWAMADEDEVNTVISSNFQRTYRSKQTTERQFVKLPPSAVKTFDELKLQSIVQRIGLIGE